MGKGRVVSSRPKFVAKEHLIGVSHGSAAREVLIATQQRPVRAAVGVLIGPCCRDTAALLGANGAVATSTSPRPWICDSETGAVIGHCAEGRGGAWRAGSRAWDYTRQTTIISAAVPAITAFTELLAFTIRPGTDTGVLHNYLRLRSTVG